MSVSDGCKGVLLCERPAHSGGDGGTPFLPSSATKTLEQVGLTPIKEVSFAPVREKKSTAMDKQKNYVRQLEREVQAHQQEQQAAYEEAVQKRQQVNDFNSKLRETILANGDVKTQWKPAAKAAALTELQKSVRTELKTLTETLPPTLDPGMLSRAAKSSTKPLATGVDTDKLMEEMDSFVEAVLAEATAKANAAVAPADVSPSPPTPTPDHEPKTTASATSPNAFEGPSTSETKHKKKKKSKSAKPGWALTGSEAERLAAAEEEELLKFAEELDFDHFVTHLDDVELQDTFKALQDAEHEETGNDQAWKKNFVRAMNHLQNKRVQAAMQARSVSDDDDDVSSMAGMSEGVESTFSRGTAVSRARSDASASTRARLAEKAGAKGWDRTTSVASDDVGKMEKVARALQAEEFLRENPELKSVHSQASVRAVLQKLEVPLEGAA